MSKTPNKTDFLSPALNAKLAIGIPPTIPNKENTAPKEPNEAGPNDKSLTSKGAAIEILTT